MISRSLEALLYRQHEERICSMRGKDLPKNEDKMPSAEVRAEMQAARDELTKRIVETFRRDPSLSAQEIGKRCGTSHPTVLRELRKAGLK